MVSNYLLTLMWVNIDTKWHKEAQKSQSIAMGPEAPPHTGKLPVSKTPGEKGLNGLHKFFHGSQILSLKTFFAQIFDLLWIKRCW